MRAMSVVAEADVRGPCGVVGAGRKLERSVATGHGGRAKEVFLDLEVAGIARLPFLAERAVEGHGERCPERDAQRDPQAQRRAGPVAPFDLAQSSPADADA
ncbi:MAG: hypothetical protein H0U37_03620 [Chloroflexi bacterium]|nr:hypothetical protein [Chloroflexota bacterium]